MCVYIYIYIHACLYACALCKCGSATIHVYMCVGVCLWGCAGDLSCSRHWCLSPQARTEGHPGGELTYHPHGGGGPQ